MLLVARDPHLDDVDPRFDACSWPSLHGVRSISGSLATLLSRPHSACFVHACLRAVFPSVHDCRRLPLLVLVVLVVLLLLPWPPLLPFADIETARPISTLSQLRHGSPTAHVDQKANIQVYHHCSTLLSRGLPQGALTSLARENLLYETDLFARTTSDQLRFDRLQGSTEDDTRARGLLHVSLPRHACR